MVFIDLGAIEALINALKSYTGGVLVVSHDQHFITSVCSDIWMIANQHVSRFEGGFEEYKKFVLKNQRKKGSA
jgi:ATP-binding cassette subfamily F protein 3